VLVCLLRHDPSMPLTLSASLTPSRRSVVAHVAIRSRCLSLCIVPIALVFSLTLRVHAQTPDKLEPQPLGTLVDVGGYRIHTYCIGRGSPTVLIVGAAFSFDWGLVQPEVAKFTQVCTFDPSGTAWSDRPPIATPTHSSKAIASNPAPRQMVTCEDRVNEIYSLISKAPIDSPYVLVEFSVGALWERLYVAEHPNSVAGMVIVSLLTLKSIFVGPHATDTGFGACCPYIEEVSAVAPKPMQKVSTTLETCIAILSRVAICNRSSPMQTSGHAFKTSISSTTDGIVAAEVFSSGKVGLQRLRDRRFSKPCTQKPMPRSLPDRELPGISGPTSC
jgi:pimeloyl-ACP methyl ester carboxylesterase